MRYVLEEQGERSALYPALTGGAEARRSSPPYQPTGCGDARTARSNAHPRM